MPPCAGAGIEAAVSQLAWGLPAGTTPLRKQTAKGGPIPGAAAARSTQPAFETTRRSHAVGLSYGWRREHCDRGLDEIGPSALVRPVLFHLLWQQRLTVDLTTRLTDETLVATHETSSSRA